MKKPKNIESISLLGNEANLESAYPTLGFHPFWEAELGNGDYFGLYWPYGKEHEEPMVCDMLHDEWRIEPSFSSLDKFLEWYELNEEERGDEEVEDRGLISNRYDLIRPKLQSDPECAVKELKSICHDFAEYSEYWFSLASQLRRLGENEESADAALSAFLSNWVFSMPPEGVMKMLQSAKLKGLLLDDPCVQRIDLLSLKFGGLKENSTYNAILECIEDYLKRGKPVKALILNQNYGYMMTMETKSFQERHNFNSKEWAIDHQKLCLKYLGYSRSELSF